MQYPQCQARCEVCLAAFYDQQFQRRRTCRGGEGCPPSPGPLHAWYCSAHGWGLSRICVWPCMRTAEAHICQTATYVQSVWLQPLVAHALQVERKSGRRQRVTHRVPIVTLPSRGQLRSPESPGGWEPPFPRSSPGKCSRDRTVSHKQAAGVLQTCEAECPPSWKVAWYLWHSSGFPMSHSSSSTRSHLVVGSLRQTQFSSSQFCNGLHLSSFRWLSCLG